MEMKVQVLIFDLLRTYFHIFHHNTTVTSTSKIPPFNIFICKCEWLVSDFLSRSGGNTGACSLAYHLLKYFCFGSFYGGGAIYFYIV